MIIALDNVRSIFNVGAIFRTSDSVGAEKLILGGYTPYPPMEKLIKTSLGALDYVSWDHKENEELIKFLTEFKNDGGKVYSVEQNEASVCYTDIDLTWEKSIYIFGNEISGVRKEILDISDHIIEIPMYGKKNSLNVSVTVGIISYEARRHNN